MKCPACGRDVAASSSYCVKCGANLKSAGRPEGETYLGGVHGAPIYKDRNRWNYSIHATDRRLLAVKLSMGDRFGSLGFSSTYCRVFRPKSKEKDAERIRELDGKEKDFELLKEDISGIELKSPSWLTGSGGYLKITKKDGNEIRLEIREKRTVKYLKELLSGFSGKVSVV